MPNIRSLYPFYLLPLVSGAVCYFVAQQQAFPTVPPQQIAAVQLAKGESITNSGDEQITNWFARINSAKDVSALGVLWSEMMASLENHPFRDWLSREVMDRMVSINAQDGWNWVKSFGADKGPDFNYVTAWAKQDWRAAAAAVQAEPGDLKSRLQWVARGWALGDPVSFLKQGTPKEWGVHPYYRQYLQTEALTALCDFDLAQALALVPNCNKSLTVNDGVLRKISLHLISTHGAAGAFELAKSLADWPVTLRQKMQATALESLALEDPARAAQEYGKIASGDTRDVGANIAALYARHDPAGAIKWALSFGSNRNDRTELCRVAEAIGPNAAALLQACEAGGTKEDGTRTLIDNDYLTMMGALATQDVERLTKDLAAQPTSPHQAGLVAGAIVQWSRQDAMAAYRALQELPPNLATVARKEFVAQLSGGWVDGFPMAEQLALLQQLNAEYKPGPNLGLGNWSAQQLYGAIARRDPAAALDALKSSADQPEATSVANVFTVWGQYHPAEAVERFTELSKSQQPSAVKALVSGWVESDPMAASIWTRALPDGANKDAAAQSLASVLAYTEPDSAFAWASTISDPQQQMPALKETLTAWKNPEAARSAIESSALPEDTKATCLEHLKNRKQ
jgi:hypothetical protein